MKEKIISALSTRYANLGVGKKALDGVASFLEKTITSEDQIDAAIAGENVLNLLKAFQGESDTLRSENARLKKELEGLKLPKPEPTPEPKPNDGNDELTKAIKLLLEKQTALETRLNENDKKVRKDALIKAADALMQGNGADNEFFRDLSLKGVEVGDDDTAETIAERCKASYDESYKQAFGRSPIPPKGTPGAGGGYQKGMYADAIKHLESSGRLPHDDSK